jgi:hypothetical protein
LEKLYFLCRRWCLTNDGKGLRPLTNCLKSKPKGCGEVIHIKNKRGIDAMPLLVLIISNQNYNFQSLSGELRKSVQAF